MICNKGMLWEHTHFYLTKISFFSQIVNIFTFTSSIISIITITLVIYLFCKHKHIRTIVASLILHKTKEVEANSNLNTETINPECSTLAYIGMALTILSMVTVIFLHYRKSKLCRGYRFSNVVKVVLYLDLSKHVSDNIGSWYFDTWKDISTIQQFWNNIIAKKNKIRKISHVDFYHNWH